MGADPQGFLYDLLDIEINTVIKDEISTSKMPSLPLALHDILTEYAYKLEELGVDLEPYLHPTRAECWARLTRSEAGRRALTKARASYQAQLGELEWSETDYHPELFNWIDDLGPAFVDAGRPRGELGWMEEHVHALANGWDSFARLRLASEHLRERGQPTQGDPGVLVRIAESCLELEQIVRRLERFPTPGREGLIDRLAWWRPHPSWALYLDKTRAQIDAAGDAPVPHEHLGMSERAAIRKIWELGTEWVVAQTCVQADGDVITRVSSSFLMQHDAQVRELLLGVHRGSIQTATEHWKSLVDTVIKLISEVGGGRRSRRRS